MKVALLTDGVFPYVIGGMQKHSFYLAKYLALNKVEVDLYHTANDLSHAHSLDCFSEEERKYIRSFVTPFPKLDKLPGHYIREMQSYSSILFMKLKENGPVDFIYVQGLCGMKLLSKKNQLNGVIGVNFHGLEMFQIAANLRSKLEQYLFIRPVLTSLKNAEVVFSLGGKLTEILILKGISKDKIIQIPIGIDPSWLRAEAIEKRQKIRFVFVGRYERRKGLKELFTVLNKLKNQHFDFDFVGTIPDSKKIIAPNYQYWGNIADVNKIKAILQNADVLVCPSYSEGMPTVILEAMASGLAVIASDVGAVREQVSDNNGILIQPGNIVQLENAMLSMLKSDPECMIKRKMNSVQFIKDRFLWDDIITKTISEIRSLIKGVNKNV